MWLLCRVFAVPCVCCAMCLLCHVFAVSCVCCAVCLLCRVFAVSCVCCVVCLLCHVFAVPCVCTPFYGYHIQGDAVCCSVMQCVAVCCSLLQCDAVCCSVLQCVAVWLHTMLRISQERLAFEGDQKGLFSHTHDSYESMTHTSFIWVICLETHRSFVWEMSFERKRDIHLDDIHINEWYILRCVFRATYISRYKHASQDTNIHLTNSSQWVIYLEMCLSSDIHLKI